MSYLAPYRDMQSLMRQAHQALGLSQFSSLDDYDLDLADAIIDEANKFASQVLAPLNQVGDTVGCRLEDGQVLTPPGWKEAYQQFCEAGWLGLALPEEYGGQGLPKYIAQPVNEMWQSSNLAFVMFAALAQGGTEILQKFANDDIKDRYLSRIVSGEWTVAMALTEPNAGSDLGVLTTKALRQSDGTYQIKGQKIYITYGEHDMAENIVHLVLARTPDAPSGSRGLSLFAVPKYRVQDDGQLSEFNDIRCTGIEHKTGLHGSPTCSISYGDKDACIGELIGEENQGLKAMFILMNEARLSCGLQGVALGELAFQKSLTYAHERVQGSIAGQGRVAIIEHPDVRRMLLDMRSQTYALRALGYRIAAMIDAKENSDDHQHVSRVAQQIALLTPIFKGFATEQANLTAGSAIQVFGGMGFVEETGIAQVMRDARITTIYEGTTGIQAKDLLHRKVRLDQGAALDELLASMRTDASLAQSNADLGLLAERFEGVLNTLEKVQRHILSDQADITELDAVAVPYLMALGGICSAWQLLTSAYRAAEQQDQDKEYFGNVMLLASFYFNNQLPKFEASLHTVLQSGSEVSQYRF
ncbi:acyl-CoA dehydrogenase [Marinomonas piezotolerans]|uniref:Acyl-CoA dehydrogenase n=1 Tax=Marinomonas piezotolerans TaxID=2213058 RepID=A0A370U9N8_9GAMM|nr:acyl-CoA dehydrogenase [Marinomonas piezotolerans]RDL44463.1 acyl-CoA dehydrogenase [Marinomonas piezotolerans]